MSLQLTVIGGSAAWPNAGQPCSAYLLRNRTRTILIDCGSGAVQELRKHIDYTKVDAILISHCHSDHILDLVAYRYGWAYGARIHDRRIPVWLPPGGIDRLTLLGDAFDGQGEGYESFWDAAFELYEYDPGEPMTLEGIEVTFTRTQHFVECYAMRFESTGGRVLGYSADTGSISPLIEHFQDAHVGIIEATLESHGTTPPDERGHLTPGDAGTLARQAGIERLILTHLWQERADADVIDRAAREYDGVILVAKPGLFIDV